MLDNILDLIRKLVLIKNKNNLKNDDHGIHFMIDGRLVEFFGAKTLFIYSSTKPDSIFCDYYFSLNFKDSLLGIVDIDYNRIYIPMDFDNIPVDSVQYILSNGRVNLDRVIFEDNISPFSDIDTIIDILE